MKLLLPFLLAGMIVHAGNSGDLTGSRPRSLGSSSIPELWSVLNNQGCLGFIGSSGVSIFTANRYLIKELSESAVCGAYKHKSGNWGLGLTRFGYENYNESSVCLGYGKKLGEKISLGMGFKYLGISINGYGKAGRLIAEIGSCIKAGSRLIIATHLSNPGRTMLSRAEEERLPTALRLGSNYTVNNKLMLIAELKSSWNSRPGFSAGIEYKPLEMLAIRGSMGTSPTEYRFGLAYRKKKLSLDTGIEITQKLGVSPNLGLSLNL